MAKLTSVIIRQVVKRLGYLENQDGTFTHPYEQKLKNSALERLRRHLRLADRPQR